MDRETTPSRRKILDTLKNRGPQTAALLASELSMTAMGARQHLAILHEQGLVRYEERAGDVGRPARWWQLTSAGHGLYPDRHAELATGLVKALVESEGEEGLSRLLNARNRDLLTKYRDRLTGATTLGERVRVLAEIRTEEGYMAEARSIGKDYELVERHCPVCEVAQSCLGLCQAEWDLFAEALGPEVEVERLEHIVQGDPVCTYRIRSRDSA